MKKFEDLKFLPHRSGEGVQARMDFENGFGISVVRFKILGGYGSYTSDETEWEAAVMKGGELCYTSGLSDDVIGHLNQEAVNKLMKDIQALA